MISEKLSDDNEKELKGLREKKIKKNRKENRI